MVGIIGAMAVEVEDLLALMEEEASETISGTVYHSGRIAGTDCVVAQCGIGKVAAAVCAQTMILKYRPASVVNVGVAGGIGKDIHIGDVVVSRGLVQHDMDTSALGDPKGFLSGPNLVEIPASGPLAETAVTCAGEIVGKERVHLGVIATGDQFIGDAGRLEEIARDFGACACEMEGGSIAQVCFLNRVPFVVIRAVSDNANEEAAVDFGAFAADSAKKSAALVRRLLAAAQRGDGA